MTQTAYVTRIIDENQAEVLVQRGSACVGSCDSCGGACAVKDRLYVKADNLVHAAEGDRVTISSRSSSILSAAALIYLLPLVTLFLAYAAAAAAGLPDGAAIGISLAGLLLGILAAVLVSRRRRSIRFEIIEVL
jgi:sigma-E factor negative regulatory protein RseC